MQVANTILEQLGGHRFSVMTGARDFVAMPNALQFRLPRGFAKGGINSVVVRLDPSDTYTCLFNVRKGVDIRKVSSETGVYAEDLRRVFTDATGLATSL